MPEAKIVSDWEWLRKCADGKQNGSADSSALLGSKI